MQRPAGPYLLAVDDIAVAVAVRPGLELRRVRAGRRLGDAESLEAQLAAGDLRQVFPLLLLAAMPEQRAHGVHLGMAGCGAAPGRVNRLQDQDRKSTRLNSSH